MCTSDLGRLKSIQKQTKSNRSKSRLKVIGLPQNFLLRVVQTMENAQNERQNPREIHQSKKVETWREWDSRCERLHSKYEEMHIIESGTFKAGFTLEYVRLVIYLEYRSVPALVVVFLKKSLVKCKLDLSLLSAFMNQDIIWIIIYRFCAFVLLFMFTRGAYSQGDIVFDYLQSVSSHCINDRTRSFLNSCIIRKL